MKIIVTFSGGKDSLASLLWIRNNLSKKFETVFCDTGWESDITYKHIKEIDEKLNLNLITLKSSKYDGMIDLAEKKGRFPSTMARFCTEELKSKPMIDFVLDEVNDHCLIIQGIRAGESTKRAAMDKQCSFFKYYFQPYGFDKQGKPKFHTYRKADVIEFCSKYSDDILRPLFEWSGKQVIDYIIENGIEPNPLYSMGMRRVGCFPCIMCNHSEVKSIVDRFPDRMNFIQDQEERLGASFFKPDYIPDRFCTGKSTNKKGKEVVFPLAKDVSEYIKSKNATLDMFDEPTSCMSFYGICE